MVNRHEIIAGQNALLAPYAIRHDVDLPRERPAPDRSDELRTPFFIDWARIIHSRAYRALNDKCQVHSAASPGRRTTRGTHTREVELHSRSLARSLGLNEDLMATIAAGHDLGHPPFGHKGEIALNAWLKPDGLHFEHNEQTLRTVRLLEEARRETNGLERPGLNLTQEALVGLDKHQTVFPAEQRVPSLEPLVVDQADRLSYLPRDLDDALRLRIISFNDALRLPLVGEVFAKSRDRRRLCPDLIHLLLCDLHDETTRRITTHRIETREDLRFVTEPIATLSPERETQVRELRRFLGDQMYRAPEEDGYDASIDAIITRLGAYLTDHPTKRVQRLLETSKRFEPDVPDDQRLPLAVKDTIAIMTDLQALDAVQEGPGIPLHHVRNVLRIYGRRKR